MEFIVAMLIYSNGPWPPTVIQGFQNQKVCEAAIPEFKKQAIKSPLIRCVMLPSNIAALEKGRSVDGGLFTKPN